MTYKYVEGITVADVAFVASGSTLKEMFESAGMATTNVMVSDPKKIKKKITKKLKLDSDSVEKLLMKFLEEFVYWKDKDMLIFSDIKVDIKEKNNIYFLTGTLSGDKIDLKAHEMLVDIKAVTWHKFIVEKKGKNWQCQVVLDI